MLLHNFISFALSDVSKEENLFIANQAEQLLPFPSISSFRPHSTNKSSSPLTGHS